MTQHPPSFWNDDTTARAKALWMADDDLTDDEKGALLGCSGGALKMKAHRMKWRRHPNAVSRIRARLAEAQRLSGLHKGFGAMHKAERVDAAWPQHTFEDDEWEAQRPFCPDLRYPRRPVKRDEQTQGGVPSGWAA